MVVLIDSASKRSCINSTSVSSAVLERTIARLRSDGALVVQLPVRTKGSAGCCTGLDSRLRNIAVQHCVLDVAACAASASLLSECLSYTRIHEKLHLVCWFSTREGSDLHISEMKDSALSIPADVSGILTLLAAIAAFAYARYVLLRNIEEEIWRVVGSIRSSAFEAHQPCPWTQGKVGSGSRRGNVPLDIMTRDLG